MKNTSKKILSFIIIICITIMSVTSLASCGSSEQNNSAKTSKASYSVSENSNENNAEDDYEELLKNYISELYKNEPDYKYIIANTSRLEIEITENGDPDNKKTLISFEDDLEDNINSFTSNQNSPFFGETITGVSNFRIRHDQVCSKKEMAEIRNCVNNKLNYTKGKDISDVHILSYSANIKGTESEQRFSGKVNVLKENGVWKVCVVLDGTRNETDLLTCLNEYSGERTVDTNTSAKTSSKSESKSKAKKTSSNNSSDNMVDFNEEQKELVANEFVDNDLNTQNLNVGESVSHNASPWLMGDNPYITHDPVSSDNNVVTVTNKGKVTAVGRGTAYVIVYGMNNATSIMKFNVN